MPSPQSSEAADPQTEVLMADEAAEENMLSKVTPPMKTVIESTISFKSDVSEASQPIYTKGVLHATKITDSNREEHCFAWLSNTSFYTNAHEHLNQHGFNKIVFIPYTSKNSWIETYPSAPIHIYIDELGNCVVNPSGKMDTSSAKNITLTYPQLKRFKNKKKLFETAKLSHDERDCLHIQMYTYFVWLEHQLEKLRHEKNGNHMMSRAGVSRDIVGTLINDLEGFKAVSYFKQHESINLINEEEQVPMLEEELTEQLEKLAEDTKKARQTEDNEEGPSKRRGHYDSRALDFDEMFDKLMQYREAHGHVDVPDTYKGDVQLARWVTSLRQKRKTFDRHKQEEAELLATEAAGEEAPKKRKGRKLVLDQERVDRLESVGFKWYFDRSHNKSWEERFQDLIAYKHEYGHCNVPRKEGTFGEWVHIQRKKYKTKEKNFMKNRYKLLQDIGFDFNPRKVIVSWNSGFKELEAFGRLNGHFNIPCPIPEHMEAEGYDGDDDEIAEAFMLYKWVIRLKKEYQVYTSGGHSKLLNEERLNQLSGIGFVFD